MLSFLHCWDYCWKFEFDINVKIENYGHHDKEQLLFHKKVHIKTQSQKKDVGVVFILLQETKNSNLFDKNCTQKNSKCHNSTWRKLTRKNRNWAGKLLVTLLAASISWKKLCSQTFKDSLEEVFSENIDKMDERGCEFLLTCRLASRSFITD